MSDKIEGVPEGWRLVRIGMPEVGEHYIDISGSVYEAKKVTPTVLRFVLPIVEKIEQPKQYRPFASAAEFEPHRDRWWRYKDDHPTVSRPPANYSDSGHHGYDYEYGLARKVFEDGSPFGVEI